MSFRRSFSLSFLFLATLATRADDLAARALATVRAYADTMLARGTDTYGRDRTPLLASALDRIALALPADLPRRTEGMRMQDYVVSGANPMHDENLYRLLYALTTVTGEPRYAAAADAALKFFLTHCQSRETGLFAWGEHLGWDFRTESPVADRSIHEFYRVWALWDRSYVLAPEACARFARGVWDHQIGDQATGNFNRHAKYAKHGPGTGHEFPRHAGFYIQTWAAAFAHTHDPVFLTAIETLARYFENRRTPDGGFPDTTEKPRDVPWASCLSQAIDIDGAAAVVPAPLADFLRGHARRTDDGFLARYAGGLPVAPADLWHTGYGKHSTPEHALICDARFRQSARTAFRDLALGTARALLPPAPPPVGRTLYPGAFAATIGLLVRAHQHSGDRAFLARADEIAGQAIDLFWGNSPLPRASTAHDHYESLTRADSLAVALLELSSAHTSPKTPLLLDYIDR